MSEIFDGFFDGLVYLVEAYLNKKVGITSLVSLVKRFIRFFVSNPSNPTKEENDFQRRVSHQ